MTRYYYLGPYEQRISAGRPCWMPPAGTLGSVDLRPPANQNAGFGFFTTANPLSDPSFEPFGDASGTRLDAVTMSPSQRAKWESMLGIGTLPAGTLLDALWFTLTALADPTGETVAKPITPTNRGIMELHLGGHSLIRSSRFRGVNDPAWEKVRRVFQNDYRDIRTNAAAAAEDIMAGRVRTRGNRQKAAEKQSRLHRRWLSDAASKLGVPHELLIPSGLPVEAPERPETTITENFNTADSDTLGPTLTWSEVVGDWDVSGNECVMVTTATLCMARAQSDLSSADHYAQASVTSLSTGLNVCHLGPACRFAAAASTYYTSFPYRGDLHQYLRRVVAGTETALTSDVAITISLPEIYKVEANGSTIKGYQAGVERLSATDTNITGNTRCGMQGYQDASYSPKLDDFEAADLGGSPTTFPAYAYAQQ